MQLDELKLRVIDEIIASCKYLCLEEHRLEALHRSTSKRTEDLAFTIAQCEKRIAVAQSKIDALRWLFEIGI